MLPQLLPNFLPKFRLWRGDVGEFLHYVFISSGMGLATSCFAGLAKCLSTSSLSLGPILGAIILAALLCVCLSFIFSEWAARYPGRPGMIFYLQAAYGSQWALFFSYLYLGLLVLLSGVESYFFAQVLGVLLPISFPPIFSSIAVLLVVVSFNLKGMSLSRVVQNILTSTLLLAVFFLAAGGVMSSQSQVISSSFSSSSFSFASFAQVVGVAIFLYLGFEWVTPLGIRPDSYKRKIPWSMPVAICVLCAVYVSLAAALFLYLPQNVLGQNSTMPHLILGGALWGTAGAWLAVVISFLALSTSLHAGLMSASRLVYVLGRKKYLPRFCTKISLGSGEGGTPVGALLFIFVLCLGATFLMYAWDLCFIALKLGAGIQCFLYAVMIKGLWSVRKKNAQTSDTFFCSPLPIWGEKILFLGMPLLGLAAMGESLKGWPLILLGLGLTFLAVLGVWWAHKNQNSKAGEKNHDGGHRKFHISPSAR